MGYIESRRDLDAPSVFGERARYIYLEEEDVRRLDPAGRVFYKNGNWYGIVYFPGRFDLHPVGMNEDRQTMVETVATLARSMRNEVA